MPDEPRVTISDPRGPGRPAEVLSAGEDRPPRRVPIRLVAAVAVVALLVVGTVVLVRERAQEHRRQQSHRRAVAAAFRLADSVHLTVMPDSVHVGIDAELGKGLLLTPVAFRETGPSPDTVLTLTLTGPGLTAGYASAPNPQGVPGTVAGLARAAVDCAAVTAGRFPGPAIVSATVLTAAHREHVQRVPVATAELRAATLQSCDLPDPDARPLAQGDVQNGRPVLIISPVDRARAVLVLVGIGGPGLRVTTNVSFPSDLGRQGGLVFGVDVTVADCAAARRGPLNLLVTLQSAGATRVQRVVAAPLVTNLPPGRVVTPLAPYLTRLVQRTCP